MNNILPKITDKDYYWKWLWNSTEGITCKCTSNSFHNKCSKGTTDVYGPMKTCMSTNPKENIGIYTKVLIHCNCKIAYKCGYCCQRDRERKLLTPQAGPVAYYSKWHIFDPPI